MDNRLQTTDKNLVNRCPDSYRDGESVNRNS